MSREVVVTSRAPEAIGPYSQGIVANGFLYTAGQIALIPGEKKIQEGGVREQTRRVLENLKGVLEAGGSSLENVVKTTVFLRDMNDFPAMNEVYGAYFSTKPPARSTVAVAGLPMGVLVEIDAVATLVTLGPLEKR
ncbi:MAG TPA: RidA family protein [bacterium]|nr:RidA family protein [bacterium]